MDNKEILKRLNDFTDYLDNLNPSINKGQLSSFWLGFLECYKNLFKVRMTYTPNAKISFIIKTYLADCYRDLKVVQLKGFFKDEFFIQGKIDVLEKLLNDLNLNIDIDKLKL